MKKFGLMFTVATATMLVSCGSANANDGWTADEDTAICTDRQGNRVDEDRCDDDARRGGGMFFWYFMSRGGYVPPMGHKVHKSKYGSYKKSPGKSYYPASRYSSHSSSRGGFGATGSSRSSAS
jgi:hypothetical protein